MTNDDKPEKAEPLPTLKTERLVVRPFVIADAPAVQRMAGDKAIARMTMNIPHPYEDGMAEEWIGTHAEKFAQRKSLGLAITLKETGELLGAMGLEHLDNPHQRAELGYWIGKEYWSNGYCTEAAREIVRYEFAELGLHRIHSHHFAQNPASGKVMQKIGMKHEGRLRQHIKKWDRFVDIECYGILVNDM